ncbi:hypothetical protein F5X96DRAFT_671836 [Biscogniauxia mediterranea]|nr:hypothetical protein F5X96DRAFT_671836 [Biscogniauxia mediterranea]
MRFIITTALLLATAVLLVLGSPTKRSSDDDGGRLVFSRDFDSGWVGDGQHHDLCGEVTWQNLLSPPFPHPLPRTPAIPSDCLSAISALPASGGWFNVTGAGYAGVQGSGYGTLVRSEASGAEGAEGCTLGVYRADGDDVLSFGIGDTDVADLLGYAVAHYADGGDGNGDGDKGKGKVHVAGEGNCGPVWFGFEIYGGENADVPVR